MRKTERFLLLGVWMFVALISLSLTPLLQHRMEAERVPNGLSEAYREFAVGYDRDRIDAQSILFPDLVMKLQAREKPFALLRQKTSNCYSCVLWNRDLALKLLRGRSFSQQDMERGANVALVSQKMESKIVAQDGVSSIELDGLVFEVIGVFAAEENQVNPQPDFILNGLSAHEMLRMPYVDGIYCLDTDEAQAALTELDAWCGVTARKTAYQKTNEEQWKDAASVTLLSVKLSAILSAFCVLAFCVVVILWVRNLRKELHVRRLCGASRRRVDCWLSGKYISAVMIGTLAALPLVSLFRLDWRAECMVLGASLLIYGLVGLAAILLVNMTEME